MPFPAGVLPYLPTKITGPLFGEDTRTQHRAASKRLNRFLDDCGIVAKGKVVHSLRHRAKDRLRAANIDKDKQEELLGHENATVGDDYGKGYPVPMLKKWIDRIGF